jgi:uncharacterized protein YbaR (Trm112 family)
MEVFTIKQWKNLPEDNLMNGSCPFCKNPCPHNERKIQIISRGRDFTVECGKRTLLTCKKCKKDFRLIDTF